MYGLYVKPQIKNKKIESNSKISIEAWKFDKEERFAHPSEFSSFISKCSVNQDLFQSQIKENVAMITNENLIETEFNKYSNVFVVTSDYNNRYDSYVAGIYLLISSEWIIYIDFLYTKNTSKPPF